MLVEYGLDANDVVIKYDKNEGALLEDRLKPIAKYTAKSNKVVELANDTYFIDIANESIDKRSVNDTFTKLNIMKNDLIMKGVMKCLKR